jgi:L-rhamnose mutarotase
MTIKYDRIMNVKPGSMPTVVEMGPKFPELAKKILGDDFVGDVRFYTRVLGPFNQVMWSWEVESMDEEMARGAKLQASEEWNKMVSELMLHIESSSIGDALWMEVSKTD